MAGLRKLFRFERPGIVIMNLPADLKSAGIAAWQAGIKNRIYRRGNAKPIRDSFSNRFLFRSIITAIIANSEETKRSILQENPRLFPSDKIKVLYNGIDLEKFDGMHNERIIQNQGDQVILGSAGRLSHEKGHHFLIEMALNLKLRKTPFRLLIAGEGPSRKGLIDKCLKMGLENEILFTGFITNIKSFMESVDIFILPSLWEGFGYVSIEAMASCKPIVAFRTGSNPEIIEDRKSGYLVNCFDISELADKVNILIKDSRLRRSFGIAGRERTERIFRSEITQGAIRQYLESLN
jgi:glycosyltransferase involved in cell wall biosynthesis